MTSLDCWYCDASPTENARFCGECGSPLEDLDFGEPERGLFSRYASRYVAVLVDPDEALTMPPDLEASLREQVIAEIRGAYRDLGMIAVCRPELLGAALDGSEVHIPETFNEEQLGAFDGLPEVGFIFFLGYLASTYDVEMLEQVERLFEDVS
jgi:hypothetical protein